MIPAHAAAKLADLRQTAETLDYLAREGQVGEGASSPSPLKCGQKKVLSTKDSTPAIKMPSIHLSKARSVRMGTSFASR